MKISQLSAVRSLGRLAPVVYRPEGSKMSCRRRWWGRCVWWLCWSDSRSSEPRGHCLDPASVDYCARHSVTWVRRGSCILHGYCCDAGGTDDVIADLTPISGLGWTASNTVDLGRSVGLSVWPIHYWWARYRPCSSSCWPSHKTADISLTRLYLGFSHSLSLCIQSSLLANPWLQHRVTYISVTCHGGKCPHNLNCLWPSAVYYII